jgi:hypothetical protein
VKEKVLEVDEMKHECEVEVGMPSLSTKQQKIKLVEKLPTIVELGKVTFLGCFHISIWALDIQEATWAKKIGLTSLKKFDWIHIIKPLTKELILNFNYDD